MDTQFKRQLSISGGVIFGSIIIVALVLYYLSGSIAGSVQQIVTTRSQISQEAESVASLAELKNEATEATPYVSAMSQLISDQDGLINFSQWLQSIATADQVSVNSSFGSNIIPASPNLAGTATFSMQVQGSPSNIATFLGDINSKPGFLLQITSLDLVNSGLTATLNAQGTIFFQS